LKLIEKPTGLEKLLEGDLADGERFYYPARTQSFERCSMRYAGAIAIETS
jgi:hypothetical protein